MVDSSNYWSRRVNRRTALRGAALGATGLAGAVLIGCSDSDEDPTEAPGGGGGGGGGGQATAAPTTAATTAPEGDERRDVQVAQHVRCRFLRYSHLTDLQDLRDERLHTQPARPVRGGRGRRRGVWRGRRRPRRVLRGSGRNDGDLQPPQGLALGPEATDQRPRAGQRRHHCELGSPSRRRRVSLAARERG